MKKRKFEHLLCNEYNCELINNGGRQYFRRKDNNQRFPYSTSQVNDILDREARDILLGLRFPQNIIREILG